MSDVFFDATEVEPSTGFEPLPIGEYVAVINDSEIKQTKSGTGEYLKLEFEVVEGDFKGRKLWANINLKNPNADAVKIGRSDLSAICHSVNVLRPKDHVELRNLPLVIVVKMRRNQNDELENVIKGYKPKANYAPHAAVTPASMNSGAAPQPPWAKK